MFGIPDGNQKFTDPESAAKTLYAVWLGDEVLDTFYAAGVGNFVAELYMYCWGILFIAVIFNVGLAIVEHSFFQTIPQLEQTEGNENRTADPSEAATSKTKKSKTVRFTDGTFSEDESSDSDADRHGNEGMNAEWTLDTPEEYKSEMYILSPVEPHGLDYPSSSGKRAIPLTTVLTRIPSEEEIVTPLNESEFDGMHNGIMFRSDSELKRDKSTESVSSRTSLDEDTIRRRNAKYAKVFVAHLRSVVMKKIGERLIENDIPNLLIEFPVDSQKDLRALQKNIETQYENYLGSVGNSIRRVCVMK